MEKLVIEGGVRLKGVVRVSGSKNSSLPIIAATALFGGKYQIENVPDISDVKTMLLLLEKLGAEFSFVDNSVEIDTVKMSSWEAPYDLVKTMRASVVVWGALLGRFGKAKISLPGGCAIGDRPVDQHLKGFEAVGHRTKIVAGYLESTSSKSTGGSYAFDVKTVTGTENLILASILSKNKTILYNCAVEPEVLDLIAFLSGLGAKIKTEEDVVYIEPVAALGSQKGPYVVIPDRIEAGTFLALGSLPGNEIKIEGCSLVDLACPVSKLMEAGVKITEEDGVISVLSPASLSPLQIETAPYPLFPTDLQAQFMSMLCFASGVSSVKENVFPNRFIHVAELRKLGAKVSLSSNIATVEGVKSLGGAKMQASDLRASACLLIAALAAKGKSEIYRIYHLDRGYESIDNKLKDMGGRIWRQEE